MKKLLITLSLLSSVSAFAGLEMQEAVSTSLAINPPGHKVTGERREAIDNAVKEELRKAYLTCTTLTGPWKNTTESINALTDFMDNTNTKLFLSDEQTQPVLSYKNSNTTMVARMDITTTSDFKKITMIKAESFKIALKTANVGTIIDPRYAETEVRKLAGEISCKYSSALDNQGNP